MVLVEVVEVEVAKVVVGDVLGKHVVEGDQNLMTDRHGTLYRRRALRR
jgi:hypothetical protein